jgi:putative transposase
VKYAFIDAHRQQYRVLRMCVAMRVSRSGYYTWRSRKPSKRAQENQRLAEQIKTEHRQTKRAYGALKMCAHLNALGFYCGKHRVERLRREYGIETRRQARFRAKYSPIHKQPPAPRLVRWPFHAQSADDIWVGDISLIPTRQGWLYLAILLDLFSRHIVGWAMTARPNTDLVLSALNMAMARRAPKPGLIHHTDQGVQYSNTRYREALDKHQLVPSMSRRGNCYDNAVAESFFSTLKNELVYDHDFRTRNQARGAIFEYIEVFYNRNRLHQSLGYQSPCDYERMKAVA